MFLESTFLYPESSMMDSSSYTSHHHSDEDYYNENDTSSAYKDYNSSIRARKNLDSEAEENSDPQHSYSAAALMPAFDFHYSYRLGLVLLPATIALLLNGGSILLWINLLALLVSYGFDSIGLSEAGFACYWSGILGSVVYSVIFHALEDAAESGLSISTILFLFALIFFFTGLYYTVHCQFFLLEAPELARGMEKFLFAAIPLPLAAFYSILLTHFLILFEYDGLAHFPFVFLIVYFLLIRSLLLPNPESQELTERQRKITKLNNYQKSETNNNNSISSFDQVILYPVAGRTVLFLHSALYLIVPPFLFLLEHWVGGFSFDRLFDAISLVGLQMLGLFILGGENYFWWLDDEAKVLKGISRIPLADGPNAPSAPAPLHERLFFLGFALAILLIAFEYRIIIHSFSNYLYFLTQNRSLLGYSLLTFGLLSGLISVLLLFHNLLTVRPGVASTSRNTLFYIFSTLTVISLGLSLGIPLLFLPVLMLVSFSVNSFFARRNYSFFSYLLFFSCSILLVCWFFWVRLWHLSIDFSSPFKNLSDSENSILGLIVLSLNFHVTLRGLILLIVGFVALTLLIPGILVLANRQRSASNSLKFFNGLLLSIHAFLLIFIEYLLFSYNHLYESEIYPPVFLIATSFLGAFALNRLYHRFRLIHMFTFWLLLTAFIGKLGILIADNVSDLSHCFLIAFAVIPVLALYDSRYFTRSDAIDRTPVFMKPQFAVFHSITLFVVFFLCKNTILAHVMAIIGIRSPNESTFFSAFLLASFAFLFPILFFHLNSRSETNVWTRRLNSFKQRYSVLLVIVLLFVVIEPRLDFLLSSDTDIPIFQMAIKAAARFDHHTEYYSWLLFGGLSLLVLSFGRVIPAVPHFAFVLGFSSCLGLYLIEYSINSYLVHRGSGHRESNPLLSISLLLFVNVASIQQFMILFPKTSIPRWFPIPFSLLSRWLFIAFVSALPFILIIHIVSFPWYFPEFSLSSDEFASESSFQFTQIFSSILLSHSFFCFVLSLSTRVALESAAEKTLKFRTQQRLANKGAEADGLTRAFGDDELRAMGNIAALLCFGELLALSVHFLEFSTLSTIAIAPLLVLFSREAVNSPVVQSKLHSYRNSDIDRYAPIALGILFSLLYKTSNEIMFSQETDLSFFMKNLVSIGLLVPGLYRVFYFLWANSSSLSYFTALLIFPLYLISMLLTDSSALRWAAAIGMAGNIWQLWESQQSIKKNQNIL